MKKLIHHVRKQPEERRRHILYALMTVCAIILFCLWVVSLGRSVGDTSVKEESLAPLSAIRDNFVGGYRSITEPETGEETAQQQ